MEEESKKEVEDKKTSINEKDIRDIRRYIIGFVILIIIILLLCIRCGCGRRKYKIIIHNGDDIIEVDDNFKLSDLVVEGGIVSFLVDSDGHIVDPDSKLDPSKEYSVHIIPDGKEKVKVTYINGSWKKIFDYLKGSGLLFPKDPIKEGYVFLGWKNEEKGIYPKYMDPVNEDMTLVAQFGKSEYKDGKCILNCDTNKDGVCDLNCDVDGDGKCDYKCDTDGRCHKEEEQGCPAGYNNGPNGCEKKETKDLMCGNPYHVCEGGTKCCEEDGTVTQKVMPYCDYGWNLNNSGDKCERWLYDVQRGCYEDGSTAIPGSFLCDVVRDAKAKYACDDGYTLSGTKCTKTYTKTINATKK